MALSLLFRMVHILVSKNWINKRELNAYERALFKGLLCLYQTVQGSLLMIGNLYST